MKRQLLINQYESVRALIVANVDTISGLIKQAEGLTELANCLKNDQKTKEAGEKIETMVNDINSSIKELIKKTTELFDEYYEFAKNAFDT